MHDNLLPLWISNELTINEAIDILNIVDGKIETAKVLYDANKIVTLFSKPVINGYGFPIISEHAISLRELECQNFEKFTCNLFRDPVKAHPHQQSGGQVAQLPEEGDIAVQE